MYYNTSEFKYLSHKHTKVLIQNNTRSLIKTKMKLKQNEIKLNQKQFS